MNITFDPEIDAMYLRLSEGKVVDSEAIDPDVIYDYDADDRVIGLELLRVKDNIPKLLAMELPFQDSLQQDQFISLLKEIGDRNLIPKLEAGKTIPHYTLQESLEAEQNAL